MDRHTLIIIYFSKNRVIFTANQSNFVSIFLRIIDFRVVDLGICQHPIKLEIAGFKIIKVNEIFLQIINQADKKFIVFFSCIAIVKNKSLGGRTAELLPHFTDG